ncbi:MAG: DUF4143 domain-containing protein [Candidatus Micrarchaeota archaeon]|nr:DUF4143 domain-containing protein [Candidatus Micrarchaeota archaeon]
MWNIVKKLAALTGNILHYSELGLSYTTIQEYLTILERSFVIRLIRPYATNPLVELNKSPKVYFYDTGFRNAILGQYEITGQTLENGVFRALLSSNPHYWRTRSKAEVDFVIVKNNKPIPIEVKSGKGKITRSLVSFLKKYKPPYAVVISSQPWVTSRLGIPIYGIPPYQL